MDWYGYGYGYIDLSANHPPVPSQPSVSVPAAEAPNPRPDVAMLDDLLVATETTPSASAMETTPVASATESSSSSFAWCSLDPVTGKLALYALKQTQFLEAAYRAGRREVLIMVHPNEVSLEHGIAAVVQFNIPSVGKHMQRTISGIGERKVCRVLPSEPHADFGEAGRFLVPESAFVCFARVAWVTVEPVQGVLQPYTRENALIVEERYHVREAEAGVSIDLPSGAQIHAVVRFNHTDGSHYQSTGMGRRSVLRISRDSVSCADGVTIPLYRRPEDGGWDSLRYRLEEKDDSGGANLEQVGTLVVPEVNFMDECNLGVDAFSPVRQIEVAVAQLGYDLKTLECVADCLKEETMRIAAAVCFRAYQSDDGIALVSLIEQVLNEWERHGLVPAPAPEYMVYGGPTREAESGESICGRYKHVGEHEGKPKFQQDDGAAILFFKNGWKINCVDDVSSWCVSQVGVSEEPTSEWDVAPTENGDGASAEPLTVVKWKTQEAMLRAIREDSAEFPLAVVTLFCDSVNKPVIDSLLSHVRGFGQAKGLMLRQVACASLWRVITQGA